MVHATSLLFTSVALLASYVNAYGQIAQVVDANNFCVFLPPSDSIDRGISDTEWNAQAFCLGKFPLDTNAGKLASGFIQSAHYVSTNQYVQITGQIDPAKAKLNSTDEGGQYDIKAPKGSSCAGWKYYVNLIEPASNTYCIRCCNDDRTCNRGISEKGCAHIIPGDYSGPGFTSSASTATTTKDSATTKAAAPTTTTTDSASAITTTDSAPAITTTATDAAARAATTTDVSSGANDTPVVPAANNSSSSPSPNLMLSQNEQASGQSISGADKFQSSMIALTAVLVAMAMMNQ